MTLFYFTRFASMELGYWNRKIGCRLSHLEPGPCAECVCVWLWSRKCTIIEDPSIPSCVPLVFHLTKRTGYTPTPIVKNTARTCVEKQGQNIEPRSSNDSLKPFPSTRPSMRRLMKHSLNSTLACSTFRSASINGSLITKGPQAATSTRPRRWMHSSAHQGVG